MGPLGVPLDCLPRVELGWAELVPGNKFCLLLWLINTSSSLPIEETPEAMEDPDENLDRFAYEMALEDPLDDLDPDPLSVSRRLGSVPAGTDTCQTVPFPL